MLNKKTQKKKKSRNDSEDSFSLSEVFSSSLKGSLLSLVISILMAIGFCLVAYLTNDPTSLIFSLSLLALYICSFLSGFISARLCGNSSLICGLISGGIFMTVFIFLSFFFPHDMSSAHSFGISFLLHALVVVFSIFGSYAGQKRKKRAHKPKR